MLKNIIITLRPKEWIKNFFIFAGLIFSKNLFNIILVNKAVLGFIIFCGITSSIYIINDIMDIKSDKQHPRKSQKPLASGKLKILPISIIAIILSLTCLYFAFLINFNFGVILFVYFIINLFYSFLLKHIFLLDVFCIAFGFVLRVFAGTVIIKVNCTPWILICTLFLSLFLGFIKRRQELILLDENGKEHRKNLAIYSIKYLDYIILLIASNTIIAYSLFTFISSSSQGHFNLMLTIPCVLYGIFRYLYLVFEKNKGETPSTLILEDKPFLFNLIIWFILSVIVYY